MIAAGRLSEAERLLAGLCEAGTGDRRERTAAGEGFGVRGRAERVRLGGFEYHLGKICTKLGIGSRVALAAKVITAGRGEDGLTDAR
ncbi:hypothetical protein AB0K40_29530 [Nonomuraea bangladeshensis]|uniref:HTH luxR-type domain-containing protein n=1 Tax=Nonomuraea bangladeshensis TaxID=404385 RepID=A0ABV3HAU9_9ACTN